MAQPSKSDQTSGPAAQILYDRSRSSAFELLKHLVSLSSAGVGVHVASLIGKDVPTLTNAQRCSLAIALSLLVVAVFTGIVGWAFDARFYERWAQQAQDAGTDRAKRLWSQREFANRVRRLCLWCLGTFFLLGVVASAYYIYLRAAHA